MKKNIKFITMVKQNVTRFTSLVRSWDYPLCCVSCWNELWITNDTNIPNSGLIESIHEHATLTHPFSGIVYLKQQCRAIKLINPKEPEIIIPWTSWTAVRDKTEQNYNYETDSMTGILEHQSWESLKKNTSRRASKLILLIQRSEE